ncbi:MAG: hypothetical protein ABI388_04720, partial [Bacteroidia bacterium]
FALSKLEQKQFLSSFRGNSIPEYIQLFKLYLKHENKNDEDIKQLSKLNNFERVKHYLHKQVLNFVAQNSTLTSQKEIMNMLLVADTLAEKSLTLHALRILHKAKTFVEKKELYIFKLLVDERIYHHESTIGNEKYYEYFANAYDLEFKNDVKIIEQDHATKVYMMRRRLFALKNNSLMRGEESINELKHTFADYIETNEEEGINSFAARSRFYVIAAYYNQQLRNNSKAAAYYSKSVEEFETINPNPLDNYIEYASAIHNLMFTNSKTHNFTKIREVLDKLVSIKPRNKRHYRAIMQSYVNYEGLYCKHHPNDPDRTEKLKLIGNYIKTQREYFTKFFFLQSAFNLSVNYFINKDFRKALELINLCDDIQSSQFLKDYLSVIRVYKLIIYFELNKSDLLLFSLRNTYRYMLKNMQYYAFEQEVITALKKISTLPNIRTKNKIWQDTYHNLSALKKNTDAVLVFHLFNFTGWIHCMLNNLPYETIMNED